MRQRFCACKSKLHWEVRSTRVGPRSLAVCSNSACGRITVVSTPEMAQLTLEPNDEPEGDPLREFMIGDWPTEPYKPPWVRLFLKAARIPTTSGWRTSGEPCWKCEEGPLVMSFSFFPLGDPYDATLCLKCGAVMLRTGDPNYPLLHRSYGGEDWSEPDPVIDIFRRAVRARAAQDPWNLE